MNGKWRISIDVIAGLLALAPISSTVYAATSAVTTNRCKMRINPIVVQDLKSDCCTGSDR